MKTGHKTHSAPLAMTFLLFALVMVPVSLKATGFNPSLSGMMKAWNQIAGVFDSGYQPVTAGELLALNQTPVNEPAAPVNESGCQQMLLASLDLPILVDADTSEVKACDQVSVEVKPAQCMKSLKRAFARKPVGSVSRCQGKADKKEFRIVAIDVQEMTRIQETTKIDPAIPVEALRALEGQAAAGRFDLNRIMNGLPLPKDVKVVWRAKQTGARAVTNISRCEDTPNARPAIERELRRRAFTTSFENVPAAGPETSEL